VLVFNQAQSHLDPTQPTLWCTTWLRQTTCFQLGENHRHQKHYKRGCL